MSLTQIDLEEREILERMVQEEQAMDTEKKMFTIDSLARILLKVKRSVAIGAIIKSELFKKSKLEEGLDDILDGFFNVYFPDFIYKIIKKALPGFVADLKLLVLTFVFRFLYSLPGDILEIEYPQPPEVVEPDDQGDGQGEDPGECEERILSLKEKAVSIIEREMDDIVNEYRTLYEDRAGECNKDMYRTALYIEDKIRLRLIEIEKMEV